VSETPVYINDLGILRTVSSLGVNVLPQSCSRAVPLRKVLFTVLVTFFCSHGPKTAQSRPRPRSAKPLNCSGGYLGGGAPLVRGHASGWGASIEPIRGIADSD